MSRFHAYTHLARPGLHLWREGTSTKVYLQPLAPPDDSGWVEFDYDLEPAVREAVRLMLFEYDDRNDPGEFENDAHQRTLPRAADGTLAAAVWFAHGSSRVLVRDPRLTQRPSVRVHLISARRFRPSELYLWDAHGGTSRRVSQAAEDHLGPYFDVTLSGQERSLFNFKFVGRDAATGPFQRFENEVANRLWSAADGQEVWTHSDAAEISAVEPQKKTLRLHYRQSLGSPATMHVWQHNGEFEDDIDGLPEPDDWLGYTVDLYTNQRYGIRFRNRALAADREWEHEEAKRDVTLTGDAERWTLEGDHALFSARPACDKTVTLTVAARPPYSALHGQLHAHVWVNRARGPLHENVAVSDGAVSFDAYPDVVTSVRFHDAEGHWESIERHTLRVRGDAAAPTERAVVLERSPLLAAPPLADLFRDPPFTIRRPGAYEEDGALHFVVHAPDAARVDVIGEWTGWRTTPLPMRSTRDGTYWWARLPTQQLLAALGPGVTDYHGKRYKLLFDGDRETQDPAAGWVESSWNGAASRLLRSAAFTWHDQSWRRPGWEYLTVYQVHVSRFTNRFQSEPPLRRVAREVDQQSGYLRDLGVTALLLLPLNEVGSHNSWGYDPAFFYAVENDYGGPDALKELVDTCHRHGLAVLLDVVFNHAGTMDNILWEAARASFFDGDTAWGAMVNFDHPQCRHFFAQNVVYLAEEYHIDGFRFDHTGTIVHSSAWDPWSGFVRVRGSGGGWDFLHALRHALVGQVDARCILMAEHLPNEWSLTNFGGPMDTQWCDDFHDLMVSACKGHQVMSRLADAFKLSHTVCDDWYKVTNYAESHDEVGNVRDRITFIAGWKRGLRMAKVAAAGVILSRGIPMLFMGEESGEDRQFHFGAATTLDLATYLSDGDKSRVRAWWRELFRLRRNPSLQGPSPLDVRFADGQLLACTRGQRGDFFVLLNFGGWAGHHNLGFLNLPDGHYRELWNSTWPAFAIRGEGEGEHTNGGREARLNRTHALHVPDYGAIVLERAD